MKKSLRDDSIHEIFNLIPNPILIHNDGKVVYANNLLLTLTGHTPEEVVGMDAAIFLSDPADPQNARILKQLTATDLPEEEEFSIRTDKRKLVIRNFLMRSSRIRYLGREATITILVDITERKHIENYILSRVMETEEKNRKQFAIDLHDDLGPTLSSIKLYLGLLQNAQTAEKREEFLSLCHTRLDEAVTKMRRIANNLMPRLLANFGLESALTSFFASMEQPDRFKIEFRTDLGGFRLPKPVELHLYRMISELVHNTVKHSGASRATVALKRRNNKLTLHYTDNGRGYDVDHTRNRSGGLGVGNIIHRAMLIDAKIEFRRRRGYTFVTLDKYL